jgi:hypothetical protein
MLPAHPGYIPSERDLLFVASTVTFFVHCRCQKHVVSITCRKVMIDKKEGLFYAYTIKKGLPINS